MTGKSTKFCSEVIRNVIIFRVVFSQLAEETVKERRENNFNHGETYAQEA
jgi:hypothetical protein